jgi:hypothetical protein
MPRRSNGFRRLAAIAQQRCPRCLQGQVFATLFRMHEQCPVCRLPFELERRPAAYDGYHAGQYDVGRPLSCVDLAHHPGRHPAAAECRLCPRSDSLAPGVYGTTDPGVRHVQGVNEMDPPLCGMALISHNEVSEIEALSQFFV